MVARLVVPMIGSLCSATLLVYGTVEDEDDDMEEEGGEAGRG